MQISAVDFCSRKLSATHASQHKVNLCFHFASLRAFEGCALACVRDVRLQRAGALALYRCPSFLMTASGAGTRVRVAACGERVTLCLFVAESKREELLCVVCLPPSLSCCACVGGCCRCFLCGCYWSPCCCSVLTWPTFKLRLGSGLRRQVELWSERRPWSRAAVLFAQSFGSALVVWSPSPVRPKER